MAVSAWLPAGSVSWAGATNPSNATGVPDGVYASTTASGGGETPFFRLYNFTGLAAAVAAASGPVPRGFEFRITGYRVSGTQDYDYLLCGSWPGGTPVSVSSVAIGLTTSLSQVVVGGPTNLFGGKASGGGAWQWSDLDATFGAGGAWAGAATWDIDGLEFRFYSDDPSGATPKRWWGGWG